MTDTVQCWLAERTYTDRNLVVLVYATPDGERAVTRELSSAMLGRTPVTAAREVDAEKLTPVSDDETRERYAAEVERVRADHAPDDEI